MSGTSIFRTEIAAALAVGLVLGMALLALDRKHRAGARNALLMLGACALASIAENAMAAAGWPLAAGILRDAAAILIGFVLVRLGGILVFRVLLPAAHAEPPRIVEDLIATALMIGWGFLWLRLSGVDFASLVTTSAVITGIVAFSMQATLGNILGGLVLQLDRSIREGDWVKIDDVSGRVVEVRWRHTAVETRNRETVVFPNSWLTANRFMVIASRVDPRPGWRRWLWFDVDIASPPLAVCDVLARAVTEADIANVAKDPAPSAVLMRVEQGMGRYALRYFLTDPRPDDVTDSTVRAHALAALVRHNLPIAFPREERLLVKDNEARRAAEHARDLVRRKAALERVDLFASLSPEERAELAERLVYAPFVKGATVTRQGANAHWLYMIVGGEADVWVDAEGGRTHVATLAHGSVFGEMGLMTGEPRRATISARTDLECYRLDKNGFEGILRSRPDIACEISRVLAAREVELTGKRESAGTGGKAASRDAHILSQIRRFFGLGQ